MQLSGQFAADNRAEHKTHARSRSAQATCVSQPTKHTRKTGRRSGGSRLAQTAKWRARTHSSHALDEEPVVVVAGELEGVELLADLLVVLEVQELDPVLGALLAHQPDLAVPVRVDETTVLGGVGDAVDDLGAGLDLGERQRAQQRRKLAVLEQLHLRGMAQTSEQHAHMRAEQKRKAEQKRQRESEREIRMLGWLAGWLAGWQV